MCNICASYTLASQLALEPACQYRDLPVKNLPAGVADVTDWVRSLGWEDPLEEYMATQSNILARRIQWTEEPDGL